jgi:hypothetical protein
VTAGAAGRGHIGPRSSPRRRTKRCLHHFASHPAKEEGIGLGEGLGRVTMQLFVRGSCTMIAAPVQCDVDGIPKGSQDLRVPPVVWSGKLFNPGRFWRMDETP